MDVEKHRLECALRLKRKQKRIGKIIYVFGVIMGIILFPLLMVGLFIILIWYFPHRLGARLLNDYEGKVWHKERLDGYRAYHEQQKEELKRAMAGLKKFSERDRHV